MPFSYTDILGSAAYQAIQQQNGFGEYDVQRVELWEMGSHQEPNNEYVSDGYVDFLT